MNITEGRHYAVTFPQLDTLNGRLDLILTALHVLGDQLMANFTVLTSNVASMNETLAKLLIAMKDDTADQAQVDQLATAIAKAQAEMAAALPPEPQPTP